MPIPSVEGFCPCCLQSHEDGDDADLMLSLRDDVTDSVREPDVSDVFPDVVTVPTQAVDALVSNWERDDGVCNGQIGIPDDTTLCAICDLYHFRPYSDHVDLCQELEDHSYEYSTDEDEMNRSDHYLHMIKLSYYGQFCIRAEIMYQNCRNLFFNLGIRGSIKLDGASDISLINHHIFIFLTKSS
jgi:hypothetical protein